MTKFGIMTDEDDSFAIKLGVKLLRKSTNIKSPKNGGKSDLDRVWNFNYGNPVSGAVPFCKTKDINSYKTLLKQQYDKLIQKPSLIIIENEESNRNYHLGTSQEYIAMLKAAVETFSIPVTNGGLTKNAMLILMYEYWVSKGLKDKAQQLKEHFRLGVNNEDGQKAKQFCKDVLEAIKTINVIGVNIHFYASNTTDVAWFKELCLFVKEYTNKSVLTTEIGQFDVNGATTTGMINTCKEVSMSHSIYYAIRNLREDRPGSTGLYGVNAEAFKKAIL